MLTLSVNRTFACRRIMFSKRCFDLWWVFAAQFPLCVVHTGGKWQNIFINSVCTWWWRFQKSRRQQIKSFGCVCSELHRLVFRQPKMWHSGRSPGERLCQESVGVPRFQRFCTPRSATGKARWKQLPDLTTEDDPEVATRSEQFIFQHLEMVFTDAGSSRLTSPFISRQSSHFPSQDSTHWGLSCGPVLSDGPVRIHVRRPAEDKRPGLHSV